MFEAGIDNYISKPFDLDHLRQILRYSHADRESPEKTSIQEDTKVSGLDFSLGLQRVGGSEETYRELLEDFIQELPGRLEVFESGVLGGDLVQLSRGAHNLRGVSANLGMIRLSELAGKLEKLCESFDSEAIEHIMVETRMIAKEIRVKVSEYLSK